MIKAKKLLALSAMTFALTLVPFGPANAAPSAHMPETFAHTQVRSVQASRGKCWGRTSRAITVGGSVWVPAVHDGGTTNCYLERDTVHENYAVRALQYGLAYGENLRYVKVDGYYGGNTTRAVVSVQNLYHLDPDGIYGPATRSKMFWHHNWYGNGKLK